MGQNENFLTPWLNGVRRAYRVHLGQALERMARMGLFVLFVGGVAAVVLSPSARADIQNQSQALELSYSGKTHGFVPAIRRIGVSKCSINVEEFRQKMHHRSGAFRGVVATPLPQAALEKELTHLVSQSVLGSGRFWALNREPLIEMLKNEGNPQEFESQEEVRLSHTYGLHGWLRSSVTLEADATRVKLWLTAPLSSQRVLFREDILLGPQPDFVTLKQAFRSALVRIVDQLGHMGRITARRKEWVTLDVGADAGLRSGQALWAGWVFARDNHPVTQEIMGVERVPLLRLRVVTASGGAAVAQVTAVHTVNETQWQSASSGQTPPSYEGLLVWVAAEAEESLMRPANVLAPGAEQPGNDPSPVRHKTGQADVGYAPYANATPSPSVSELPVAPTAPQPAGGRIADANPEQTHKATNEDTAALKEPVAVIHPTKNNRSNGPTLEDPSTWRQRELSLGLGLNFGTIQNPVLRKSSSFPSSLINALTFESVIQMAPDWRILPFAAYHWYTGRLEGNRIFAQLPLFYRLSQSSLDAPSAEVGAGVVSGIGRVKGNIQSAGIEAFQVLMMGSVSTSTAGLQLLRATAGVSPAEVFEGRIGGILDVVALPMGTPHGLSLTLRMRRGPATWAEFCLGIQANIL